MTEEPDNTTTTDDWLLVEEENTDPGPLAESNPDRNLWPDEPEEVDEDTESA